MSGVSPDLPRMIARVARRIAEEAELPPVIRRIDVGDALAAIAGASEAIAVADAGAYGPAYAQLSEFDIGA